jgi:MFS family permease
MSAGAGSSADLKRRDALAPVYKNPAMWLIVGLSVFPILAYNWLPVLFNTFQREFGANLEMQGATQQYMFLSGLVLVFAGGPLTRRLGWKWASVSGVAVIAVGLAIVGLSPGFPALLAGCVVYGFGIAWMYLIYGVLVSRCLPGQRQQGFLINNMILSLVGGAGPALLGLWISLGLGWRAAFLVAAGLNGVCAGLLLAWRRTGIGADPASDIDASSTSSRRGIPVLFTLAMWVVGIAYVLHGAAEIGIISWAGKLYNQRLGISEERMALFISVNVFSFAVGRFLLTFVAGRFRDLTLLAMCAAGGTLFFSLTLTCRNYYVGLLFMSCAGMCMSGNAPAMNSYLSERFAGNLELAFAVFQGFGAVGSALAPRLIGFGGDRFGLETAIWLVPLSSGALALLAFFWRVLDTRSASAHGVRS